MASTPTFSWTITFPPSSAHPIVLFINIRHQIVTVNSQWYCSRHKGPPESLWSAPGQNKPVAKRALQLAKNIVRWMVLILHNIPKLPTHSLLHDHFSGWGFKPIIDPAFLISLLTPPSQNNSIKYDICYDAGNLNYF